MNPPNPHEPPPTEIEALIVKTDAVLGKRDALIWAAFLAASVLYALHLV